MKNLILFAAVAAFFCRCDSRLETLPAATYQTVCNPFNISYMFQQQGLPQQYREGADPTVVLFGDEYYAFVSHSGGYFHSTDLINWDLIVPNSVFPTGVFAPTTVVIDGEIYLIASQVRQVVKTADPKSGVWEVANPNFKIIISDPALFLDDDGRLYYYGGCSNVEPVRGYELDPKTFEPISEEIPFIYGHPKEYGWEEKTDYNLPNDSIAPHIEGAWMNKYNGKYYLQYAAPGTELKSYNDGVYVSDKPLGPYTLAEHNPFSYKPEGFTCGAGHSSTFQDRYGNYWHIATSSISVRHPFERRLSLFPLFFDGDGEMYAYTGFGDYPMILPDRKINAPEELFPDWMLLSYGKKVEVSSILPEYKTETEVFGTMVKQIRNCEPRNINDEEIRTWWSAETGGSDEWFFMDLDGLSDIYALQINFADEGSTLKGRSDSIFYRYTIEASADKKHWETVVDRSNNTVDMPHDYIQLPRPVKARYLRVKNIYCPSGKFSVSDFRVFGKSDKAAPKPVQSFTVERDAADRRTVHLKWDALPEATGYNIRFGTRADKLYHNYIVYRTGKLSIHSLNAGKDYFFSIDAFNEGGITKGTATALVRY
ncbi:MAG: family 43 glycosylhydrolase [Prevotellaceae bacterium]|jgi:hypothetical protein|nr:family 43 glycosylhydrolase [Prevotellaceae bacterium]